MSARAPSAPTTVSPTVYAHWHGEIIFSVKEFYSPACHDFYGYSFAWLRFRRLHVPFDVGMAVYDVTHDAIDGARTYIGRHRRPGLLVGAGPRHARRLLSGRGPLLLLPAELALRLRGGRHALHDQDFCA